jgi:hypothetical protein
VGGGSLARVGSLARPTSCITWSKTGYDECSSIMNSKHYGNTDFRAFVKREQTAAAEVERVDWAKSAMIGWAI